MKNNDDEYPSIPRWYFSTCVPFITLITQHQDILPLRIERHGKKQYGIRSRRGKFINFMLPILQV